MVLNSNHYIAADILHTITTFRCLQQVHHPTFTFSIYKNGVPGSGFTPYRNIIETEDLSDDWIMQVQKNIPPECELAINSLVKVDGNCLHLALIDFSYPRLEPYFLSNINTLQSVYGGTLYLYRSGRSFHGYQDLLLSEENWKSYLGHLLLLNKGRATEEVADSRWVGHSLVQGFSALRISHRTDAYFQMPHLERTFLSKDV